MTEKRYDIEYDGNCYKCIVDCEKKVLYTDRKQIVDLLNEQHEQINTLRKSRRELISVNNEYRMRETELAQELSALVDENEQLKQQCKDFIEMLDDMCVAYLINDGLEEILND